MTVCVDKPRRHEITIGIYDEVESAAGGSRHTAFNDVSDPFALHDKVAGTYVIRG